MWMCRAGMPASRMRKTAAAIEAIPPPTSQTWLVAGSRWDCAVIGATPELVERAGAPVTARKKASSISPRGDGGADRPLHGEAAPQGVEADRHLQAGERRPQAIALDQLVERGGEFGVIGGLGGVVARGEGRVAPGVKLQLDGEQRPFGRLRQFGEALGYAAQRGVEVEIGACRDQRAQRLGLVAHVPRHQFEQQVVLAVEVRIKGALRIAGRLTDAAQRGRHDAAAHDFAPGGLEQPLAGLGLTLFAADALAGCGSHGRIDIT